MYRSFTVFLDKFLKYAISGHIPAKYAISGLIPAKYAISGPKNMPFPAKYAISGPIRLFPVDMTVFRPYRIKTGKSGPDNF
jgi:hypothetical protein